MINYDAKSGEEYLLLLEKELEIKQRFELDTLRKSNEINNQFKNKPIKNKGSLTELKKLISNSTTGHNIKRKFGKLSADFCWRTLCTWYCENDDNFKHLQETAYCKKEKDGILQTWDAINGDSPFEKLYNEDILSPFLLMKDLPFIEDLLNKYLFIDNWNSELFDMIDDTLILKELRSLVQGVHKNKVIDDKKSIIQLKAKMIHELVKLSKNKSFEEFEKLIPDLFSNLGINQNKVKPYLNKIDFKKFKEVKI